MSQYLLHIIIFQLVFLLVFELLLKKETFFNYNRLYLLTTPVISLLLPFLSFESLRTFIPAETTVLLPEIILGNPTAVGEAGNIAMTSGASGFNPWWMIYGLGVLFSLILFIKKYRVLSSLFRNKVISEDRGLRIIEVPGSKIACTFFSTIFLGDQLSPREREQILSHEMVHVDQKHSLDLLYFEVFKILFWFNPLVYIYQLKISALHEFIADAGVVKTVEKKTYYQQLLNTAFNTENISFINQFFNHSLIKKRIVMLQKSKSRSIAKLKFLVLLPVMFCMLSVVSYAQETGMQGQDTEEEVQLMMKVGDVEKQTAEEQKKVEKALETLREGALYTGVVVTDGTSTTFYKLNKETGKLRTSTVTREVVEGKSLTDVPFMLIENVPVFPGCEGLNNNTEKKDCMKEKIQEHVKNNFNTSVAEGLPLKGVQKVYVQFKINEKGKVVQLKARGPAPVIEEEAIRVVNSLPVMTPGEQNGKAVGVLYSLPIQFRLKDKDKAE